MMRGRSRKSRPEHFLRRNQPAAPTRVGRLEISTLLGEECPTGLHGDVRPRSLSPNPQEPGADCALDMFARSAEHLGGLFQRKQLARTEDTRRSLPRANHGHRPTRVPTDLHAHAITMLFLPR